MTNKELVISLIQAAHQKRFDDLMALIDEHQPDLSHDDFIFKTDNGTITGSVAHVLVCYVAKYGSCAEMGKILPLGCCPNSNMRAATELTLETRTQIGMPTIGIDKYYVESRPLFNAIDEHKEDMVDLLLNYACPCCNGAGAKATQNLLDKAQEVGQTAIYNKLLAAFTE